MKLALYFSNKRCCAKSAIQDACQLANAAAFILPELRMVAALKNDFLKSYSVPNKMA